MTARAATLAVICSSIVLAGCPPKQSDEREVMEADEYGSFSIGIRKKGKKHGTWLTYDKDGRPERMENWRHGIQHGPVRHWDVEDGMVRLDAMYKDGEMHGRFRVFWGPGKLSEIGWTRKGRRDRTWCRWRLDGSLKYIKVYDYERLLSVERDPTRPCPVIQGEGRRHLDTRDGNYD